MAAPNGIHAERGKSRRWLSFVFPKPAIFISYAREDEKLAMSLMERLEMGGFDVYLDKEKTLVGEQFLAVIVGRLRRCDAVLALLSAHSAESEWCQAELYYAHALRRTVVPVRLDEMKVLEIPSPLALLMRETQYVPLAGGGENVFAAVEQRFRIVRRRSRWQWARRAILIAAAVAFLAWGFQSGFSTVRRRFERVALISRIDRSGEVLRSEALDPIVQKFAGDETLRSLLLAMAEDRGRTNPARLNARIIAAKLGSREKRWYVESLKWDKSTFSNADLNDTTFRTGAINAVQFSDVSFGGVFWNQGPDFSIGGSTFSGCRFHGGEFAATSVIDTDFINCLFYGTALDLSGFGAVRFTSKSHNPNPHLITDGTVTVFERAVIVNCVEAPKRDVLDFGGPENEVKFTQVVFESCRFRGFIRPEWFVGCSFDRCTFPPSLSNSRLEQGSNFLSGCSQLDENCP